MKYFSIGINGVSRKICNGSPRCCSETNKCGEMEGDCNSDFDCLDGLRCGNENCNENSGNWVPGADCCYKPKRNFFLTKHYICKLKMLYN